MGGLVVWCVAGGEGVGRSLTVERSCLCAAGGLAGQARCCCVAAGLTRSSKCAGCGWSCCCCSAFSAPEPLGDEVVIMQRIPPADLHKLYGRHERTCIAFEHVSHADRAWCAPAWELAVRPECGGGG